MPKPASTRSAYKMLTCIYLCRTLLFFAPYADFFGKIQWEASAYEVSIPALLHGHFMEHYNRLNNECCEAISNRMQGVVRRNGLMAFRIIMVQTIVRHLADECYPDAGRTTSETRMY